MLSWSNVPENLCQPENVDCDLVFGSLAWRPTEAVNFIDFGDSFTAQAGLDSVWGTNCLPKFRPAGQWPMLEDKNILSDIILSAGEGPMINIYFMVTVLLLLRLCELDNLKSCYQLYASRVEDHIYCWNCTILQHHDHDICPEDWWSCVMDITA